MKSNLYRLINNVKIPILDISRIFNIVYQILNNHPEIKLSAKSLYMYIESGVFQDYGINTFSLRRQVSMRKRKKLKTRKEPVNYDGKRYKDYLQFIAKKTSESMASTLNDLQNVLQNDYYKLFSLILTDRRSEFEKYELFEINFDNSY